MVNYLYYIIYFAVFYFIPVYCIYVIATKFKIPKPWRAWIPILNLILLCEMTAHTSKYVLLLFIPLINWVIWVGLWMEISERLGRSSYLGILAGFPIVNLFLFGYLAFSSQPIYWE